MIRNMTKFEFAEKYKIVTFFMGNVKVGKEEGKPLSQFSSKAIYVTSGFLYNFYKPIGYKNSIKKSKPKTRTDMTSRIKLQYLEIHVQIHT